MNRNSQADAPLWASLLEEESPSNQERNHVSLWYRRRADKWLPVPWPDPVCSSRPSWETRIYTALDLETTGLRPSQDRIIELALVRFGFDKEGALMEQHRLALLVNPGIPIPEQARAIHGITDSEVANAPTFSEIASLVAESAAGSILVAHNALFDIAFLETALAHEGLMLPADEAADTLGLAKTAFPDLLSYNLGKLALQLRLPPDAGHRALGDALTCMRLFATSMRTLTSRCD